MVSADRQGPACPRDWITPCLRFGPPVPIADPVLLVDRPNATFRITRAITSFTIPAVLMVTFASVSFASEISAGEVAVSRSGSSDDLVVRLFDLASVRRAFGALARQRAGMTDGERVAAWADFSQLAEAVIGNSPLGPFTFDDLSGAAGGASGPHVIATRGVSARSRVAYQMQAVGYSARETADVVNRRISRRALDTARRMIAVGQGRDKAAAYLDSQYTRAAAVRNRHRGGDTRRPDGSTPSSSGTRTPTRSKRLSYAPSSRRSPPSIPLRDHVRGPSA